MSTTDNVTHKENVKLQNVAEQIESVDNTDKNTRTEETPVTNSAPIKINKKLPRSQRKRLIREQRRARRKTFKQEGNGQRQSQDKSSNVVKDSLEQRKKDEEGHVSKRIRLQLSKERCQDALQKGQRICVDLSLEKHMNGKEHGKLAQQLCRLYGSNRHAPNPAHVYFTGLDKNGELYKECVRKNAGFDRYIVDMSEKSHLELFPKAEIVYLTPDSENLLDKVEQEKVYVIGGLVDESITNNITKGSAKESEIRTARLPIEEKMHKDKSGTFIKVLAVNQVFDILLELSQSGDWTKALNTGVPRRTGFYTGEQKDD